jgi:hypothetical protein
MGGLMDTQFATSALVQMQFARTQRARDALENGLMTVFELPEDGWMVVSKDKTYIVAQTAAEPIWRCTCPDYTSRCHELGLHCKHIEAVCLSSSMANTRTTRYKISEYQTEEHMHPIQTPLSTGSHNARDGKLPAPTSPEADHVLSRLKQPLDMSRVKRRKAPGGSTVPYLEGHDVIEMANQIFAYHWSFDLLSEPKLMRWERIQTVYDQKLRRKVPLLDEAGQPVTEEVGIVWITGKVTIQIGNHSFTDADVGRCTFTGDTPQELDTAIAGSATDCLKRCFRQLGDQFGNVLYNKAVVRTAGNHNGSKGGRPARNPARPARTKGSPPVKDQFKYTDGELVDVGNEAELDAFKAYIDANPNQVPASRQVLRLWIVANNGGNGQS